MTHPIAAIAGIFLIVYILWEGFETIIVTRTVDRPLRLTSVLYRYGWRSWRGASIRVSASKRETFLGYFGSLSLLGLLVVWANALVLGFALIHWSQGASFSVSMHHYLTPIEALYLSGTTFFTLGYGDITPVTSLARLVAILEAGLGFAFLAVVIGYLPIMYQSFSKREVLISMLDSRAGTPPSGLELLRRAADDGETGDLTSLLTQWEKWAAELLENSLSYPVLVFYRSQHERTSWLTAITCILDTCALIRTGINGIPRSHAGFTFAMGRHAIVDLSLVLNTPPNNETDRLSSSDFELLTERLRSVGLSFIHPDTAEARLREIRRRYEPYVASLGNRLMMPVPPWISDIDEPDNWETSAYDPRMPRLFRHF